MKNKKVIQRLKNVKKIPKKLKKFSLKIHNGAEIEKKDTKRTKHKKKLYGRSTLKK